MSVSLFCIRILLSWKWFVLQILINRNKCTGRASCSRSGRFTVDFLCPVTDAELLAEESPHGAREPARPAVLVTHVEHLHTTVTWDWAVVLAHTWQPELTSGWRPSALCWHSKLDLVMPLIMWWADVWPSGKYRQSISTVKYFASNSTKPHHPSLKINWLEPRLSMGLGSNCVGIKSSDKWNLIVRVLQTPRGLDLTQADVTLIELNVEEFSCL